MHSGRCHCRCHYRFLWEHHLCQEGVHSTDGICRFRPRHSGAPGPGQRLHLIKQYTHQAVLFLHLHDARMISRGQCLCEVW